MTEPTDAELWQLYIAMNGSRQPLAYACAVLAKWGQPAQAADPVASVTGYFHGYPFVTPLDKAAVLPIGMALYAAPQPVAREPYGDPLNIDHDRVLQLADVHAQDSREDGVRLLDRGALLAFAKDVLRVAIKGGQHGTE